MTLTSDQQQLLDQAHQDKKTVVLVTGVFDLLHAAHRQFLIQAKMQGDFLVVGVESDIRVRQMKGEGRPINDQAKRQQQVENLQVADLVFVLPESFSQPAEHEQLIAEIKPAVLAVSQHTPHQVEKQAIMAKYGGRLAVVMNQDKDISTSLILQKLAQ